MTRGRALRLGLGLGALAFGLIGAAVLVRASRPPLVVIVELAVGCSYVAAGIIAWERRPGNRIGPLALLVGVSWFVGDYVRAPNEVVSYLSQVFRAWYDPLLAILILSYPSGRLARRGDRVLAAGWLVVQGAWTGAKLLLGQPLSFRTCPTCPATVDGYVNDTLALDTLGRIETSLLTVLAVVTLTVLVRRWMTVTRASRRLLAPVVLAGVVLVVAMGVEFLTSTATLAPILAPDGGPLVFYMVAMPRILVAVGVLVGLLRSTLVRSAVAQSVFELGALPTPDRLERALRRRLADPNLQVVRWSRATAAFLDRDGRTVVMPADRARTLTILERDGEPQAGVLHDTALLDDPALLTTMTEAVRLALDTSELRDELRARGGDAGDLPPGEVTFLFGDIEDSSGLLEATRERYADLLTEFRSIVSEICLREGGRVVDARADEVFAVFVAAGSAVAAAVELQRRMAATPWPGGAHVAVRVGVHTGNPEVTPSGYIGVDVHRAARIMAAAHGGQILASTRVARAMQPSGVSLRPLGSYELRGLSGAEELLQVEASGLAADFPALRAIAVHGSRLRD